MTDRELIEDMLTRAGIPFVSNGSFIDVSAQGYFGVAIDFHDDGRLKEVSTYE